MRAFCIILIGLRCAGKTSLGEVLANQLRGVFRDLDDLTAQLAGCTSAGDALRSLGEAKFREVEEAALRRLMMDVSSDPRNLHIISLGGGTPSYQPSAALLRSARSQCLAHIVYLHASPAALQARMSTTVAGLRPPLLGTDSLDEINVLYAQRDPIYRALADITLDTSKLSVDQALKALLAQLRWPDR